MKLLKIFILLIYFTVNIMADNKVVIEKNKYNSILTQIYRWYIYYENPNISIGNQLDIFTESVVIKNTSSKSASIGKDQYIVRVEDIPKSWLNAHHFNENNINFIKQNNNEIEINYDIYYQNVGILPNNQLTSYKINYNIVFTEGSTSLPKISQLTLSPYADVKVPQEFLDNFQDVYVNNRVKATMHYWLSLVENPKTDAELAKEILAKKFTLNFSPTNIISNMADLKSWFANSASKINHSSHKIENFKIISVKNNTYTIQVEFEWHGKQGDTWLEARTKHTWVLEDNTVDRFARIKSMKIEILKPFTPKA